METRGGGGKTRLGGSKDVWPQPQCFKEWGGGRSPSMDPLNVLMQAPPCLIPSHNPRLPFPLDASDTENSYPYLKHRFPGDEACFHQAGSFLTFNLGRGSSPRHLLITMSCQFLLLLWPIWGLNPWQHLVVICRGWGVPPANKLCSMWLVSGPSKHPETCFLQQRGWESLHFTDEYTEAQMVCPYCLPVHEMLESDITPWHLYHKIIVSDIHWGGWKIQNMESPRLDTSCMTLIK